MLKKVQDFEFGSVLLAGFTFKGSPIFIAKQVAEILGYTRTDTLLDVLDDDESVKLSELLNCGSEVQFNDNNGLAPTAALLTESGLYHAIFKSTKAEAKAFRKWVTEEVLPSIRKHGYFHLNEKVEDDFVKEKL